MTTKQKLTKFIKKRPYLVWWVKKYSALDAAAIVEATLNYGDWDDVQELIKILGMKETARIFREKSKPSKIGRTNYRPRASRYFSLYFNKYNKKSVKSVKSVKSKVHKVLDKSPLKLPDLLTLSAMKAFALSRRPKWKDYVDLYFIIKSHYLVGEISEKAKEIFQGEFNERIFREALVYFADVSYAEPVEYMKGFEVSDKTIEKELIKFSLS